MIRNTEYWNEQVRLADSIAAQAHECQFDKGGSPYVEHPRAVAAQLEKPQQKAAALLHDVVEDTDWNAQKLASAGVDPEVIGIVLTLTHKEGETYWEYLERVRKNPEAVPVKAADLTHNSRMDRIPHPGEDDCRRLEKYRRAMEYLLSADPKEPQEN